MITEAELANVEHYAKTSNRFHPSTDAVSALCAEIRRLREALQYYVSCETHTDKILKDIASSTARLETALEKLNSGAVKDRRERIATACLQGLVGADGRCSADYYAREAIRFADALIAELDK
jgi:phage host-nuclease inhibitor protein Gam